MRPLNKERKMPRNELDRRSRLIMLICFSKGLKKRQDKRLKMLKSKKKNQRLRRLRPWQGLQKNFCRDSKNPQSLLLCKSRIGICIEKGMNYRKKPKFSSVKNIRPLKKRLSRGAGTKIRIMKVQFFTWNSPLKAKIFIKCKKALAITWKSKIWVTPTLYKISRWWTTFTRKASSPQKLGLPQVLKTAKTGPKAYQWTNFTQNASS